LTGKPQSEKDIITYFLMSLGRRVCPESSRWHKAPDGGGICRIASVLLLRSASLDQMAARRLMHQNTDAGERCDRVSGQYAARFEVIAPTTRSDGLISCRVIFLPGCLILRNLEMKQSAFGRA
jgi:hypothetical protein